MTPRPRRAVWTRLFWAGAGLALLAASAWQHSLAARPQPPAAAFVVSQLLAGAVYLAAVYAAFNQPPVRAILRGRPQGVPEGPRTASISYLLLIGIACRLILLPTPPLFDDDIHRYLWDGKVLAHGINPFRYAPQADELSYLRDANWRQIGYPHIPTIYPPLAQVLLGLSYALGARTVVALKSVFFLFDLANMALIILLLGRLGRPRSWALVYAWSPLASKEFANSGHVEPVMLFFTLLAFWFWLARKPGAGRAGASLGAAISVKFAPALLLPIAARLGRWRSVAAAAGLVIALYLPFAGAGKQLFHGAGAYAQAWTFNDGAFALLSRAQSLVMPGASILSVSLARALVAVVIAAYAVYAGWRLAASDHLAALRTSRNVLALCLLLAPTVDPWYVCWLLPFLAVAPSPGLLVFTVTSNLCYLYYAHRTFPVWIPIAEYVPVYLLLVGEWLRSRWLRARETPGVSRNGQAATPAS
jgi:hypothetical protein